MQHAGLACLKFTIRSFLLEHKRPTNDGIVSEKQNMGTCTEVKFLVIVANTISSRENGCSLLKQNEAASLVYGKPALGKIYCECKQLISNAILRRVCLSLCLFSEVLTYSCKGTGSCL